MTSINKLTLNPSVNPDDLLVIWDYDNQRTRSITAESIKNYTDENGVNSKAFVSGKIENNILTMTNAAGEDVIIGATSDININDLSPNTVPIVNQAGDAFVDSGITETDTNIVVNKTLIVPQESILIGPAIKLSDKGGYLGVSNIAEDSRGFGVVSKTYETEAQRDLEFTDSVPRIDYQYLVPAKWVYQFPFEDITSDDNLLSFEFEDSDNTFIRKLRLFSTSALTGVRVWIENLLPDGDALVWENVSPENQAKGQGLALSDTGFSELETGFIKISTANIKFRFSIQAMTGEKLNLIGSSLDLGFGTGFYPKMYTYTQDSIKTELLDGIDTAHNRFGEFKEEIRFDSDSAVVRSAGTATDEVLQPDFSVLVDNDRPDITETNGSAPTIINSVTVKHQGTWGPVQVSFSDLRTKVVNLVDGDNTITLDGKPLVIEANEDYYIRFTGAVGTGSETQISLLGDSSGEIYASINKSDLDVKGITLDGVESIVAGNNITVNAADPKNPIISSSGGSGGAGITIDIDGTELSTGIDTLDFDSSTMNVTDINPSNGKVEISAKIEDQTNFVGLFDSVSALQAEYPTPKDGLFANVTDANGKPDDRYKSQSNSWVGIGAVSGDVFVNDNKSLGIITGDGLKYEDDSGLAKISLSGVKPVAEFDVTIDSTRTISPSMIGEVITIIQTPPVISIPMIITLEAHANFSVGDTVAISADRDGENPYTNYYFAVNYTDATGRNLVKYPANNMTMIRTVGGWNVSMDGRYTNVSIRPKSQFGIPYAADEQYNTPVNAFVFAESDAVEFDVDEDTNTRIVKIDLDSVAPDLSNYVEKYSKAELNYIQMAYDGKFGNDRSFYPFELRQDVNGWTQEQFTGVRIFQSKDKNSGALGDKILELGSLRVDLNKPSYVEGKRIAERTTHHIYNSYSLSDLINPDGKTLPEWVAENPGYTQIQFLSNLFSCTILGRSNWIVSATTSGESYNGTFPNGYQQIEIHRNGGGSRSFLRAYNKESPTHYFANYKSNTELNWKQYAYTDELSGLNEKISYDNEIANVETIGSGVFAEYLGYGSTSAEHSHTFDNSGVFWVSNLQSSARSKIVNVSSGGSAEATGVSIPFNRVVRFTYSLDNDSIVMESSFASADFNEFVSQDDFKSKSGYNRLSSGGGSTHKIEFWENGSIFKLSNSKIEVRLLEGMQDEDGKRHGYVKYINNRGSDVNFEWYDRNGNQINNSSVPSVCPADTVVEIFANYSTDDYAINFSQSKVISSSIAEAQTPSFTKFINTSNVTIDYPLNANGVQYRPQSVVVTVLDTDNLISDLNINVTSNDGYDGHYNSVGSISIDDNGEWSTESRRNAYRLNDGTNTYCVFSDSLQSWVLIVSNVDHNHIGSITGGVPVNLYNDGQLPESYGGYAVENNLDSIESEYFSVADADIDYHTNSGANSYFTVKFGNAKPAGIVFYR